MTARGIEDGLHRRCHGAGLSRPWWLHVNALGAGSGSPYEETWVCQDGTVHHFGMEHVFALDHSDGGGRAPESDSRGLGAETGDGLQLMITFEWSLRSGVGCWGCCT